MLVSVFIGYLYLFVFGYSLEVDQRKPIAQHDLVVIKPTDNSVIRLKGFDTDGAKLTYKVLTVPTTGKLNQLSMVYSNYGYDPKAGTLLKSSEDGTVVTGSNNRVYYTRPTPDSSLQINKWGSFNYLVRDGTYTSYEGTVTLVPPSGALVGSNFLLNNNNWMIIGNKASSMSTTYEPFSRGALLNHYVIGMDDKINVADSMSEDKSLWYFQAPSTFLGNHGIAYGGYVSFTLASLSGDFEKINSNAAVIQLDCNDCIGPVGKGITLHYPMSALSSTFDGSVQKFDILLHENSGWLKDPQNTLLAWNPPTQCDIIQVLSRLSSFRILGDWTRWYETIALDDVSFHNTKSQLPICSMIFPDASICTCDDEDEVASANSTSF